MRGGVPARAFYGLSGLDQARALLRGEAPRPPVSHLTGWRITQVGSGSATLTMPASPWLRVPDGSIDVPILLEASVSIAASTGAPPGMVVRTAALTINHFRPVTTQVDRLIARARVVNTGRTFTFAETMIEDDAGRAVAHGTASLVAHPLDPPPSGTYGAAEPVHYSSPDPWERPPPSNELPYDIWNENDGITNVRRMTTGELGDIPIYLLTGMRLTDAEEGMCIGELKTSEWITDSSGAVSPGVIASFVSIHLAGATLSLSPGGRWMGIIDQSLSLPRTVSPDAGKLLIRANVISRSEDFIVATAEVTDDNGHHVSIGYQTAVLRERTRGPARAESKRTLTTVLFTDIVGSTSSAERVGDAGWQDVIEGHNTIVRRELRNFRGREIKTMGDGFLAVFDSPARAVHCARAVRDSVRRLGIEIRAGLHTGECDFVGDDVSGIAVAVAARIQAAAGPSEILVSNTVRELVVGSGLQFADHGEHSLKGVEGDWRLFSVDR